MGPKALPVFLFKIGLKFKVEQFLVPFWGGFGGQNWSSWASEGLGSAL